jgi:hypothetical protein
MNVITHVQYYFVLFSNPVVFLPDILLFSCLPAVQYSPIPRFDVWLTSSPVFSCRSAIHLSNIGTSFCSIFRCPAVPVIFCRRPPIQYLAILKFDILLGSSYFTCYRPSIPFSAVLLSNIWSHVQNSELFCPYVQYFDVLLSKMLPFFYPIFGRSYSLLSPCQMSAVLMSNILPSWCPIRCRPHGQNYAF